MGNIFQEKGRTSPLAFSSRIISLFEIASSSKTCRPYSQTVSICIRVLLLSMAKAIRLLTLTRYLYSSSHLPLVAASFARGAKLRAAWSLFVGILLTSPSLELSGKHFHYVMHC